MISVIERLTALTDHNGDPVYAEPDIRRVATHAIELVGSPNQQNCNGLLAVCEDGIHVEFSVFRFASGPATIDGVVVEPATYEVVFYGGGPSSSLRELRHTYWGQADNGGYIFYPNAKLITAAFAALRRWFDCD
jgi:hypothetical protein